MLALLFFFFFKEKESGLFVYSKILLVFRLTIESFVVS